MKISTTSFFLLLTMVASSTVHGQSKYGFRAGIGSGTSFYAVKEHIFLDNFSYDVVFTKDKSELVKYLDFTWQIHPAIVIGFTVTHNTFSFKTQNASSDAQKAKFRQATITFRSQYDWVHRDKFHLYTSMYEGYGFTKQYTISTYGSNGIEKVSERTYANFAMHLNLLGVSVGKKAGGFVEFGVGFKGYINSGLFVKL